MRRQTDSRRPSLAVSTADAPSLIFSGDEAAPEDRNSLKQDFKELKVEGEKQMGNGVLEGLKQVNSVKKEFEKKI